LRPRAWLGEPRRWLDVRRKRFWVVAVVLFYTLAGYFLLPPILQRQIVASLEKTLDRPVVLEDVRIDPFALSADLRGFHVREMDGSPLFGFDRLYLRLAPSGLLHWAWGLDEIRLEGAKGNIVRFGDGQSNLGRLLRVLAGPAQTTPPATEPGPTRLIIRRARIEGATLDLTDQVPATPFKTTIGPLNAEIDRFSTLPEKTGEQHALIDWEGGATLEWTSTSGLAPLVSSGHVVAKGPFVPILSRYFGDAIRISAPTGTADVALDYRLQQRADGVLALVVDHASLAVTGLALREIGETAPFLAVPELRLSGGHLAWPDRTAGADSLSVSGVLVALRRDEDGRLGPAPWLAVAPPVATALPAPPPSAGASGGSDWSVALGKARVGLAKVTFVDHALRTPASIEIAPLDLAIESLSNQAGASFPFSLETRLVPGGQIGLQGRVSALPEVQLDAKLSATDVPLAIAQAYLHDLARLAIDDGRLDGQARITVQTPEGLTVSGHGEIRALKLRDEVENRPVVSWDRLGVDHCDYRQAANDLQISQVTIGGPYLRFQVAADQSTNFSHILPQPSKALDDPRRAPRPGRAKAPAMVAGAATPMTISVGKIVIARGAADYGDASLPLPFAAHVTALQGEVATLVSGAPSPARVSLKGQVAPFGDVKIEGRLTPFEPARSTNINVLFRNVEFPGLSPYTVKFAGRRIAKGRLDVDLRYIIDQGRLTGANRVVIRDVELGERVDVPGATNLPLDLAIALLKDEDGKIDVDLPVGGNLNDPEFDVGSVISKAIFNLLGNLITSPFRALAGLLGGGGDTLDHIDFPPGRAALDPPEQEKILHLAKAIKMRPNLVLVVPGVVDPQADRSQLQFDALDARMAASLGDHDTVTGQRRLLESLFAERIGQDQLAPLKQSFLHPPEGQPPSAVALDEPAYVAALRESVAKTEPVGEANLASLAQARADAVAGALRQVPGIDPRRVSLKGSTTAPAGDDGAIPLKLDAASAGAAAP
jgi:hypothetical protein